MDKKVVYATFLVKSNQSSIINQKTPPKFSYLRGGMYTFLRKILFCFGPEWAHYFSMNLLKAACAVPLLRGWIRKRFTPVSVDAVSFCHLQFRNPVGLGAGFDKNARYLRELEALGFGFVEIGTVTPIAQPGNEKPRLFRLPADRALINRMGFNNDGVERVTRRLAAWRRKNPNSNLVIGGNIGKNKQTPNEEAWKDYESCFRTLHAHVDYFVVNVSSPNTPGLRALQDKDALRKILLHLQMINNGKAQAKPVLLKIAPDLTSEQIDDVLDLAQEIKLDGLVVSNTTISRENLSAASQNTAKQAGGLSGAPLQQRNTAMLHYIYGKTNGSIPVIASGGIFTGKDAQEKLTAGASLVQVWTGFIYEGPAIVKRICKTL